MTTPLSVHILWHGAVLCGSLHGQPRSWAGFTRWIGLNDPHWRDHATCPTCREQAELFEQRELAERGYRAGIRPPHRAASLPLGDA